ncbi:PTS sugar transporter subunit IIA [Enterococcus sp. LJL90]
MNKENVRINVNATNREEAIMMVGNILVDLGSITRRYIEECLQVLEEYGPYFVIAPGIAFVHSKPSENVLESNISLITLSKSINFGSLDNDPVSIVFMIASTDGISHIELLKRISLYLSDDNNIQTLKHMTNENLKGFLNFMNGGEVNE